MRSSSTPKHGCLLSLFRSRRIGTLNWFPPYGIAWRPLRIRKICGSASRGNTRRMTLGIDSTAMSPILVLRSSTSRIGKRTESAGRGAKFKSVTAMRLAVRLSSSVSSRRRFRGSRRGLLAEYRPVPAGRCRLLNFALCSQLERLARAVSNPIHFRAFPLRLWPVCPRRALRPQYLFYGGGEFAGRTCLYTWLRPV